MLPILQVQLFGEFNITYEDAPVAALHGARLQSLLAYLLLHADAAQPRQHLAYLFWPDAAEVQARNNLRQTLHQLRRALPGAERFLHGDVHTLHWRVDTSLSLDVRAFEQALARAAYAEHQHDPSAWRNALEEAVGIYRADLLPSCYDEWIVPDRERLRQLYLGALAALVRLLEAQHAYVEAIRHAQDWTRYDPLAEDAYRALMRLLALTDDRAGALRIFRMCAMVLRRELGVEPSSVTRAMFEQLLRMNLQPAPPAQRSRLPASAPAFIGRRREWEKLQAAWQHAMAGEPRFVLVSGEAGIGKSRLAEELLAWAGQHQAAVAKARSYAAEGHLSLAPVTDWLRSDAFRPHLGRLDAVWRTEIARILPELLTEHRDVPRPEPIEVYGQRQRFEEPLARAILAAPPPLVLLIDDLQWCDQESLEWLHFLLRFDTAARLLVVGTVRAEELVALHPLRTFLLHVGNTVGLVEIDLKPLDAAETAQLAAEVAGRDLDTGAALRLFRETEGNPLFVLETVRAELGRTTRHVPEATTLERQVDEDRPPLTPRVYTVIAGRLAQLSPSAGELVGVAAAIGRSFSLDILVLAAGGDEASVVSALDELWNKRIVREHGINSYDFTHDKLREVAYAELSAPQRRLFHRRIAQAIGALNAEDLDAVSGQIAFHYERAGMAEQALPHYQRAASVAQRVYANDEAIGLLSRGLALLEGLPASPKRDAQELQLLLALAPLLRVTHGWAAPELERVLARSLTLCETIGNDAQRAQVQLGQQSLYVVQARLEDVQHVSDGLETLYRRSLGAAPPLFAGVMLAGARMHLGHLKVANDHFSQIIGVHDLDQLQRLQEAQGANFKVLALGWQSHVLWCLGYPQSALNQCRQAVRLAHDLAQPFNQALAAAYLATLLQLRADDGAMINAEEALALTTDNKAPYYRAWSAILLDYARAWERPDPEHIALLRGSIAAFIAGGARLRAPYFLSLLARVYIKAGRANEALSVIDEALAAAHARDERWWDAELHRLRGEVLLMRGVQVRDGQTELLCALETARAQHAKSLELRAATSLARLWGSQQRADEGRRLLADLLDWFTEGFDTPDFQRARTLLAQLA